MKNGSGKNSAARLMKWVILGFSADPSGTSNTDFLRKMIFFCHVNFFGLFWKYLQHPKKIWSHLGDSVHIPIDYFRPRLESKGDFRGILPGFVVLCLFPRETDKLPNYEKFFHYFTILSSFIFKKVICIEWEAQMS